jgi:hypothetical protein
VPFHQILQLLSTFFPNFDMMSSQIGNHPQQDIAIYFGYLNYDILKTNK